ncbi:MAG TPA: ABC transporter permease, partial [Thermoanaerobaculia bacterium]|nr:ABC transporter permease [Thermoanaerobaculia bacterium]
MDLTELFTESFAAMRRNKLRSFLTLLGIVIGVATLVGVVSVISGLNAFVRDKLFGLAPDVYVVSKFGIITSHEAFIEALKRRDLDQDDLDRLASTLRKAERVGGAVETRSPVTFGDKRLGGARIDGSTANYSELLRLDLAEGRFFLDSEARAAKAVAVIGWDVKDELFPHLDPIGRTIAIGGVPFRVIGLVTQQGRVLGSSRDNYVYVPIDAYRQMFGARDTIDIFIQASNGVAGLDASVDETRAVLRALRHTDFRGDDPFGIVTADALQTLWKNISAAAFILSVLIASVSLGVGGIVIMNIMLVAVAERTYEIGIRKALGARRKDILAQFLVESTTLSMVGAALGVVLGAALAQVIAAVSPLPAYVAPWSVALAISIGAGVGIIAGSYPASRASRL